MAERRRAIVTGAASGLGKAIAGHFVAQGLTDVFGVDRDADALASMEAALGRAFAGLAVDLLDQDAPERVVRECVRRFGSVDILVNNVGAGAATSLHSCGDGELAHFIDINLGVSFRMSRATLAEMMAARKGVIVNIASAIALTAMPGQGAYAAAKGGLIALTRQMAAEYGPFGVRVNAVAPGLIETPFTAGRITAGAFDGVIEATPLRRLGEPEDVAQVVAFLASAAARHVTGQIIAVDGGWSVSKG